MAEEMMSSSQSAGEIAPAQQIIELLIGKGVAQAVSVAADLGIADVLADAPKSVEELAAATSTHAPSLYRLLRALASRGIFAEQEDRRFNLTPLAECLRSDAPASLRNLARLWGMPLDWRSWGELLHAVKTGDTGLKQAFGVADPFVYLSQHPEEAQVFHDCMTDISRLNTPAIVEAYDFGRFRQIVDVGGSHGMLLSAILCRYPGPHGVVFDLPEAVDGAQRTIAGAGLTGRCEAVGGDFFESVPQGADAYLSKQVIHDFDDERAAAILRNIRRAIRPEGRLLLIEFLIPPSNEHSLSKFSDLDMLVVTGGRERTAIEYGDLFAAAGFRLTAIHPASQQSVIEGVPVATN